MTTGINNWMTTGVLEWRKHHIAVLVSCHLSGDQLDTCDEDHALNQEVFNNPAGGGRIVTVFHRNGVAKMYCISDDWGGVDAVTTVLFASEY